MIFENTHVNGFSAGLRGMRNPLNSWEKSDSNYWFSIKCISPEICGDNIDWTPYWIGENDMKLAQKLVLAGTEHAKFMRIIHVSVDITAPRYFFVEHSTYKFGTTNSCSTIHTLLNNDKPILLEQFEYDERDADIMLNVIFRLEKLRSDYKSIQNNAKVSDKKEKLDDLLRRAKIILPEGYLQLRTWDTNYAELRNIWLQRRSHKLKEWHEFCSWVETLPYAKQLITYLG